MIVWLVPNCFLLCQITSTFPVYLSHVSLSLCLLLCVFSRPIGLQWFLGFSSCDAHCGAQMSFLALGLLAFRQLVFLNPTFSCKTSADFKMFKILSTYRQIESAAKKEKKNPSRKERTPLWVVVTRIISSRESVSCGSMWASSISKTGGRWWISCPTWGKKKKSSFKFMVSETMQLLFHFPPMPLHPLRRPVSVETIQYFEE